MQCQWDTDQFPNSIAETALALYLIMQAGGFSTGGLNFDSKVRRQSIDPQDMFYGHVGAMDVAARALLVAEQMLKDGKLAAHVDARYAGWTAPLGQQIMHGGLGLDTLAEQVLAANRDTAPASGRQEYLENLLNSYL
jgi:xylose isomerase